MQYFDVKCPLFNEKKWRICRKLLGRINGGAMLYCPHCKVEQEFYATVIVPLKEPDFEIALMDTQPES